MEANDAIKQIIVDALDMCKYKVLNGKCTPEELRCIQENVVDKIIIDGTLDDIAKAYGQSKNNVKAVMSRNQFQKTNPPKTKKFYDVISFAKIIPKSWRRSTQ